MKYVIFAVIIVGSLLVLCLLNFISNLISAYFEIRHPKFTKTVKIIFWIIVILSIVSGAISANNQESTIYDKYNGSVKRSYTSRIADTSKMQQIDLDHARYLALIYVIDH